MLKISNLFANIGDVKILNGVDLEIGKGELHAVMGPNGSGKSTLCHVLMGNPDFEANGEVKLNGSEILGKPQFERADNGIFQSYQYPVGLPGVSLMEFAMASTEGLNEEEIVSVAKKFNVEALLDEIDSGLDIDAIKTVANLINENRDDETSYLLVTHYSRILRYLDVDRVHIVVKGNVVKSGSKELIEEVDSGGYTQYQEQ